jgi:hypothetical protein
MTFLRFTFVFLTGLHVSSSAFAQWEFSVHTGGRYVRMDEFDDDGKRLVRESGWLPGIGVGAKYNWTDWHIRLAGELYRNDITYDGQLQNGAPFKSETETDQQRITLEVGKRISDTIELLAAAEHDIWRRDIQGRGRIGLHERYSSWRFLAGARGEISRFDAGIVSLHGYAVFSQAERLRVRPDRQVFDTTTLKTEPAVGARLGFGFQPAGFPNLSFETDLDWIRVDRSKSVVATRNGFPARTIWQPEHERAALGIRMHYRF